MFSLDSWKNIWENKANRCELLNNKENIDNNILIRELIKLNGFDGLHSTVTNDDYYKYISEIANFLDGNGCRPSSILEIGCGAGLTLDLLSKNLGINPKRVIGIDYANGLVKIARKYFTNVQVIEKSIEEITSKDINKSDLVFANSVCQYIDKKILKQKIKLCIQENACVLLLDIPDEEKKELHLEWKRKLSQDNKPTLHSYYKKEYFLSLKKEINVSITIKEQFRFFGEQSKYRFNVLIKP